jgi:hypothetical protein
MEVQPGTAFNGPTNHKFRSKKYPTTNIVDIKNRASIKTKPKIVSNLIGKKENEKRPFDA